MKLKLFNVNLSISAKLDQDAINTFMDSVQVTKTSTQFVPGNPDFWSVLVFYNDKPAGSKQPDTKIQESDLVGVQKDLYAALRLWRRDRAQEINLPEFMVLHNETLMQIAVKKPTSISTLALVRGIGDQKLQRYCDDIVAICSAF